MKHKKNDSLRKQQITEFLNKILFDYSIKNSFSQLADNLDHFEKLLAIGRSR